MSTRFCCPLFPPSSSRLVSRRASQHEPQCECEVEGGVGAVYRRASARVTIRSRNFRQSSEVLAGRRGRGRGRPKWEVCSSTCTANVTQGHVDAGTIWCVVLPKYKQSATTTLILRAVPDSCECHRDPAADWLRGNQHGHRTLASRPFSRPGGQVRPRWVPGGGF